MKMKKYVAVLVASVMVWSMSLGALAEEASLAPSIGEPEAAQAEEVLGDEQILSEPQQQESESHAEEAGNLESDAGTGEEKQSQGDAAEEASLNTRPEDVAGQVSDVSEGGEGTIAPADDSGSLEPAEDPNISVTYQTHVQTYGWQDWVSDGAMSGTSGEAKRLEGIKIKLGNQDGIRYRTHVQTYGWQDWVSDGDMSGTSGEAKRLEAIQIELTGSMAEKYDVYYRVHAQTFGWMGWAKNGGYAGSSGYAKRLEGIEIRLVAKGGAAPGSTEGAYRHPLIQYQTHVQTYGWQGWKQDGAVSGTSGQAKRLEGIEIRLVDPEFSGDVRYKTHVQTYGWQDWVSNGAMSGTSGQAKRLEAIQIELTGDMAAQYDIYYRVHAQTFGWMGWAHNGEPAGTAGYAKRLEGIEIQLVLKGGNPPGSTENYFREKTEDNNQGNNSGNEAASKVIEIVNQERAKENRSALKYDAELEKAAMARAKELEALFSHTRPDGSSCFTVLGEYGISYSGAGENIAAGQRSPEEVMNSWMNSQGHRENIMQESYEKIGVGHYQGQDGTQYWVQLFIY